MEMNIKVKPLRDSENSDPSIVKFSKLTNHDEVIYVELNSPSRTLTFNKDEIYEIFRVLC